MNDDNNCFGCLTKHMYLHTHSQECINRLKESNPILGEKLQIEYDTVWNSIRTGDPNIIKIIVEEQKDD
jgi:hypothetical protein